MSNDPQFAAKVADVVGLYLDPPGGAVVLSVDEKTQIQALDRTQPLLPIEFGMTEQRPHIRLPTPRHNELVRRIERRGPGWRTTPDVIIDRRGAFTRRGLPNGLRRGRPR